MTSLNARAVYLELASRVAAAERAGLALEDSMTGPEYRKLISAVLENKRVLLAIAQAKEGSELYAVREEGGLQIVRRKSRDERGV